MGRPTARAMDVAPSTSAVPAYETVTDPKTGKPLEVFTVRMRDRQALAKAVGESMRETYKAQKGERVGHMIIIRLLPSPATKKVPSVPSSNTTRITNSAGGSFTPCWSTLSMAEQAATRRRVGELTKRTRRNLAALTLTEATRRKGHTLAFPATVVVGAQADGGEPLADLLATLHVRVTAWTPGAQNTQGMQRVYRHALREGLITPDVHRLLSGTVGTQAMHELLGVPAHRLWSAAVHQHAALAESYADAMNRLIKQ
ncbi:hypothetical protein ABT275_45615 [Streptomyces sp. NPDC001185]|uniref:hypothetical protein n=1 Tax=Streptomyces sp. NPDC001185 TaxID=3154380 RepID=UPI0033178238